MGDQPLAERPRKFRKKPPTTDAILWTGNNYSELATWMSQFGARLPDGAMGTLSFRNWHGSALAAPGDWIVYEMGQFYPLPADIFEATYEPVE